MNKAPSKVTLADKITSVLNAVPVVFDPEEEPLDDTSAKLTNFEEADDDDEELLSKFRKQNIDLLADVDQRYAGKKGSRRTLEEDSTDGLSESEPSENEDVDSNFYQENNELNDQNISGGSSKENDTEDEQSSEVEYSENEDSASSNEENHTNFRHMSDTDASLQVKKGLSVRNQMNIWENLLEVRIQLQKCLLAANKMPQGNYFKEMLEENDSELDFNKKIKETKCSIGNVLDKFLELQSVVINRYPETKNLDKKYQKEGQLEDPMDEEIASDTEDECEINESLSDMEIEPQKKKRKLSDYEKDISEAHHKYKSYRNEVIEKWNAKTRLSMTKNNGQAHSVVSQIEHILGDRQKLVKRTQLKRTEYNILGQKNEKETMESNEENGDVKQIEEYNSEIFDDNDFYHQLLRELIEVKSADITDPVQLGRQWIQLQNLRSKMKRKIDTKATKGRKIRYAVHTKLVNFMAPLDNHFWTEEAKNELYSSLFGKIKPKNVS